MNEVNDARGQEPSTAVRQVDDIATLKALSDPLRLAILRCLMADVRTVKSVKEIAKELNQPTTRLYRHVKMLESVGLVKAVDTRVVSGIIEYRYQVAQGGLRLSRELLSEPGNASEIAQAFAVTLDDFRARLIADIRAGRLGYEAERAGTGALKPMIVALDAEVSAARATEFRSRLEDLMAEFNRPAEPTDEPVVPVEFLMMFWSPR